jgi:hypothetical protein
VWGSSGDGLCLVSKGGKASESLEREYIQKINILRVNRAGCGHDSFLPTHLLGS